MIQKKETLQQATRRVKHELEKRGWKVSMLVRHRPFHLIAYKPNGRQYFIALCKVCDYKRKRSMLDQAPADSKVEIFTY